MQKTGNPAYISGLQGQWQSVPNISYISIAFPIWWPYLFLKNTQSCFWPGRTCQNHLKVCTFSFLDVLITMVVVRSLSDQQFWDKFVSHSILGILQKNPTWFWALPHTPSYPFLLSSPDEIWSLSKQNKKHPWPSHKKKVQLVKKYGTFCSYFLQI